MACLDFSAYCWLSMGRKKTQINNHIISKQHTIQIVGLVGFLIITKLSNSILHHSWGLPFYTLAIINLLEFKITYTIMLLKFLQSVQYL